MADLGTAAREQTPALADLRAAAPAVTSLLNTLRPFSQASLPAVTSLGDAAKAGRTASREAASLVGRLGGLGATSAEPAKNLRIILDHLDDRRFAVQEDPDSPTGKGYTGLEAPLQYVFDQSLAANIFDQRGYSLKINLTTSECSEYTTADDVNADAAGRAKYDRCNQNLGPNQPGITTADPSPPATRSVTTRRAGTRKRRRGAPRSSAPAAAVTPGATPAPVATPGPIMGLAPLQQLIDELPGQLARDPSQDLLDFLLRP
jgi:hypothetical protein